VAWSFGGAPKTGKTRGMPPRMGLEPSSLAAVDRNICWVRAGEVVHEVTVAPKRLTVTESPDEGRRAVKTLSVRSMVGCGREGEVGMAEGLFLRSIW